MSYILLSFVFMGMAAVVAVLIDYFGNRKSFPWYVLAACFISYFFPFTIILMLPLDLASTRYRDCSSNPLITTPCDLPLAYVSEEFLYRFWEVVYWITFNVQMFVVPIMQGYVRSGELSFGRRLWSGIKDNLIFYCICGSIGSIFVLYALFALHISAEYLLTLAIPATNAYGLLLLTILMGYGLVEVPRGLWYNANVSWVLRYLEVQAPKLKEACVDSETDIYDIARLVGHASRKIETGDALRPLVDQMMEKCPLALQQRSAAEEEDDLPNSFTRDKLIDLHARIKYAAFLSERDQALLKYLEQNAFLCQDIIANYGNSSRRFKSCFISVSETDKYADLKLQAYWWWFVWIRPIAMRSLSVMCVIASLLVIWSESTFQFTSVTLSIPALIVEPGNISYGSLEILAIGFVCYMCTCTYSTLLTINIFEYYKMVPEHHTNEVSLLFVGAYLCKLTFPLCYNFLNMGGLAEGVSRKNSTMVDYSSSPVFIQYFGPAVNLTPLFGAGYNDWVAHLVLITCVVISLNLHGRILRFFRMENYFYETIKPNNTDVEEGQSIISQARTLAERKLQRGGTTDTSRFSRSEPRARNARELLDRYKNSAANSNTTPNRSDTHATLSGSSRASDNGGAAVSISDTAQHNTSKKSNNLLQGFAGVSAFFTPKNGSASTSIGDGSRSAYQKLDQQQDEESASVSNSGGRSARKFGVTNNLFASSQRNGGKSETGKSTQGTKSSTVKRGGLFDDV
ncbi:hypothetical protein QVD99_003940 [Batrachochytrium dendrobatidis]|nr:hypothetical protein O5D80_002218 [Batrachochytrium dendrobatidis]KAK5669549.1 hypothetical protein QVD99_003940 [Batrachochytrium dendrobatidis]